MDKVFWEEGVKAIPTDMNDIHNLTEGGLGDLIGAFTGGEDTLLFDNAPPVVAHVPPNINVNLPDQNFAVLGVPGSIGASLVVFPDAPTGQHRVFFVISRTEQSAIRDVLEEAAGTLSVVSKSVVNRVNTSSRIEQTSSVNPITPAPAPSLGPDDLGYIEYCTIIWDGITLTENYNTAAIWQFPGGTITVAAHGPSHLPGAADPIPVAAVSGAPSGSDPGLMPEGSYGVLINALQLLTVSGSAPFLTRVVTGDNLTPITPKSVELGFRTNDSFTTEDIAGDDHLALSYTTGPYSGDSKQPARANHTHSPSQSPVAMVSYTLTVAESDLGKFLTIPEFTSLSEIYQTQVYWVPPGQNLPLISCDWIERSIGTIGAKAHVIAGNKVRVETGSIGFTNFNQSVKDYIITITGSVTWTASDNGMTPRSGQLIVRLIGER